MKTKLVSTILLLLGLSACHGDEVLRGNGQLVESSRSVSAFTGVSISDEIEAEVELGATALTLHYDANLLDHVRTRVDAGVLDIGAAADVDLDPSPGAVVRVKNPTVGRLEASGASRLRAMTNGADVTLAASGASEIDAEARDADLVSVEASGSSHVRITGAGPRIAVDASGAATVESEVPGVDVDVEASGASEVTVRASASVRIRASGTSVVTVLGGPAERDVETSGQATVVFAD